MPDIAMCENNNCKRRKECYRFMAKPDQYRQAYGVFDHEHCEYFVEYYPPTGVEEEQLDKIRGNK